ncbi:MAG: RNA polymerase sigma factor [Allomuricauda sp.]
MSFQNEEVKHVIETMFRTQYGKMVSYLTSKFGLGFLENAEDIVQETLSTAFQKWAFDGVPENPEAWIFVVARNKAYNLLKKEQKSSGLDLTRLVGEFSESENQIFLNKEIEDNMLRIILVCCNLELPTESKVVFILSCLCGFSRKELSQALLMKEETVKKRLFRAKKAIRSQNLSLTIPDEKTLKNQVGTICSILYILFNQGYNSSSREKVLNKDICFEAMRLTKLLLDHFPKHPKIHALFALMCFHSARFMSRIDDNGAIVLFGDQNRDLWNQELIRSGIYHLSQASSGEIISAYHFEAAIAAEHCTADDFKQTNWSFILQQYQQLYRLKSTPVILLNIAIVKSMLGRIDQAIEELIQLKENPQLGSNYLLHATLGELFGKQRAYKEAITAFDTALQLTRSPQELKLLRKKKDAMKSLKNA